MCEAMRRLMKDEIEEEMREAQREGRIEGQREGRIEGQKEGEMKKAKEMAISLAGMGMSVEKIADVAKVSVKIVQEWLTGNAGLAR